MAGDAPRRVTHARRGRARPASCRDGVAYAEPLGGHVAGSLQSELGCPGDWQPECAATHLTYDAGDDVWQRTFSLPAASYEYKAALNDSWTENYGLRAQPNGANVPLSLPSDASVKFYYDHKSHWVTDNRSSVIAVAPGSFQSELGCPADWDPGCLRSWLQDPDGNGIYAFETTALPQGSYEAKVDDQRELGRELRPGRRPGRLEHPVHGPGRQREGHVLLRRGRRTSSRSSPRAPQGAPDGPGALSHFGLARKDCLGTARNTTSKVWYTVANGVLSDVYYPTIDNTNVETLQYVVTDGSTFTDLQTRDMTYTVKAMRDSGGMACEVTATAKTRHVPDRDRVPHRSRTGTRCSCASTFRPKHAGYRLYVRFDPTVNGNGGGGPGQRRRRPRDDRRLDRPSRCSSPSIRSRRPTRRTATTRSRSTPPSTARSRRRRAASRARRATGSSSSTPRTR